jgi:regulatory protein
LEREAAAGLKAEQYLSEAELERLLRANEGERALAVALRLLARRPHSRREMAHKLARKQFDEETVEHTLNHLTARGLLNDAEFARLWCENREAFRPRSRAFIGLELRGKGLTAEDIKAATADLDDEASALQAGEKRARILRQADHETFCRRLGDYLRRRGYNYEVIQKTINQLWQARV